MALKETDGHTNKMNIKRLRKPISRLGFHDRHLKINYKGM